jgi:hypothetical protein
MVPDCGSGSTYAASSLDEDDEQPNSPASSNRVKIYVRIGCTQTGATDVFIIILIPMDNPWFSIV